MNHVYVYDGDYLSLLNTIFYLLKTNQKVENIKPENYSPTLFENIIHFNIPKQDHLLDQIIQSFGISVARAMYYVFLSEEEKKELLLYYFVYYALKYRKKIMYQRNLKCVREVLRISNYVLHESHKMKGFLRFQELQNHLLYAEMSPTNDILFLLSCHFSKRLKNEFWIIKDVKRKIISIYDKKKFVILFEREFKLSLEKENDQEKMIEDLWKTFYNTIGIQERKNDRCRMNFMPKKYWKYITEVRDEL